MFIKLRQAVLTLTLGLLFAAPALASEPVVVTNKSGKTVRVKVWCGLDVKTKTLKNGKSFTWKRNNTKSFNVRVYRKQGKLIKTWKLKRTSKNVDYSRDITIAKGDKIKAGPARHTVLHNASSVAIVVYIYNGNDEVRLVARKSYTIQPGKSATWKSTQSRFHVKVSELRNGLNRHVATKIDIARPSKVTITNSGGWDVRTRGV